MSAKAPSVPAIPSASATQESFPETIIIPFNKSSIVTLSFNIINIDEKPLLDILHAFSDIITSSLSFILSSLRRSKAIIEVIILVIEAG